MKNIFFFKFRPVDEGTSFHLQVQRNPRGLRIKYRGRFTTGVLGAAKHPQFLRLGYLTPAICWHFISVSIPNGKILITLNTRN